MMRVSEVAKRLQVSKSMVYALVDNGKLVAHRVGLGRGTIRISETDLNDYLDSCRVQKQERNPASKPRLKHLKL